MSELIPSGEATASVGPPDEAAGNASARRGVLCVKCEKLNELDAEKCDRCGTHLYVFCHRCGARNARVHSRCEKCRRRLHRTVRERWKGGSGRPINLLYVGLTLIGILVVIVFLLWAADIHLPRLW